MIWLIMSIWELKVNRIALAMLFVTGIMIGYTVASFQFNERLLTITENVGQYVKNQQQINAVYEPSIIDFVIKTKE